MSFPAAILFDMDGLLVDSEPVWGLAERDLATSLGTDWPEEEALACVGAGLPGTVLRIAARAGLRPDTKVLVAALVDRFLDRAGEVMVKPGALALVEAARARSVPIAVATSSPRRVAERVLMGTGLLPAFTAIACGDEVDAIKPAPDVYRLAASRLGVDPEQALVLEDSPAGAQAGRRAGATVYAVPEGGWRGRGFEPWVDLVCGSLDEVRIRLGW
jgi:HAD superfamily hydrolase (TIGR01509 family)